MGVNFDVIEYCRKLRSDQAPPFHCPIDKCDRSYRSTCGLQYHLQNFDHENPQSTAPVPASVNTNVNTKTSTSTPRSKNGKKGNRRQVAGTCPAVTPIHEALTYAEVQKMVQFEIDGRAVRVDITDEIPMISDLDINDEKISDKVEANKEQPTPSKSTTKAKAKQTKHPKVVEPVKLPEPSFCEMPDYNISDAPPRSNAYIRFIEKPPEELDEEVEYDVDEEDTAWLSIMNEKRESQGICPVAVDTLELLMDRLEKESYFQASATGQSAGGVVDDDAVCCICMDGECQNTNVILFCDMCNLAVHQDCYGVPYIPEGQWLCRKCLQSPSRPVDCVLCPNHGGAVKQTDRGLWAHVVCALWIPEVRFANTVFLEPIDSVEMIPSARWKLTCYVCKQRGVGACIQCHNRSCFVAFHVTCAQQAGLYMKMDTVRNEKANESANQPAVIVEKLAFCDTHAPPTDDSTEDPRKKMQQARKILAKKRTIPPVILIPTIPPERVQEICSMVHMTKKPQFIQRLLAYWTLKRQFRNGVPLLRRLQSSGQSVTGQGSSTNRGSNATVQSNSLSQVQVDIIELCKQLKYWQCLRQDLERARLLCELVRKREKLKLALVKAKENIMHVELKPLEASLRKILDALAAKDDREIFLEPVDVNEVPDYTTVVKKPMDISTMREKLDAGAYTSLSALRDDFDLMISNCLAYNNKETVFYKAGIKMRDAGKQIFTQAHNEFVASGLIDAENVDHSIEWSDTCKTRKKGRINTPARAVRSGSKNENNSTEATNNLPNLIAPKTPDVDYSEIDREFDEIMQSVTSATIPKLEALLVKVHAVKSFNARTKRLKLIKGELGKIRRTLKNCDSGTENLANDNEPMEESADDQKKHTPPLDSNLQSITNDSPIPLETAVVAGSGINRRTAVLFTRKQAAMKRSTSPASAVLAEKVEMDTSDIVDIATVNADEPLEINDMKAQSKHISGRHNKSSSRGRKHGTNRTRRRNEGGGPGSAERLSASAIPESFRIYRGANATASDEDESDSRNSCCSGSSCSYSSCSGSSLSDSDTSRTTEENTERHKLLTTAKSQHFEPLQLVWAKCRGYPWYPALIISPDMPKGYVHRGVPIPSPPQDVLNLEKNHPKPVYLILFFDARRTWQWLPPEKLEPLGVEAARDQAKVTEPRKPTDRKAVRRAFQHALLHQCKVNGPQGPDAIG